MKKKHKKHNEKFIQFPDYTGFGPEGNRFQDVFMMLWTSIMSKWDALVETEGFRPLEIALDQSLGRAGFWFDRIMMLAEMNKLQRFEFECFWDSFRIIFNPELPTWEKLASNEKGVEERANLLKVWHGVLYSEPIRSKVMELNKICFGPFSQCQMTTLLKGKEHGFVELGPGGGYLMSEVLKHGGDIIGLDTNTYQLTHEAASPWTKKLMGEGRLIVANPEEVSKYAKRTLIISWPEPGADLALKAYTDAGGKRLVFKLGGFVGVQSVPGYIPPSDPAGNCKRFFNLLIAQWKESGSPAYLRTAMNNNMFCLERKWD